jgi:hypothetical protein
MTPDSSLLRAALERQAAALAPVAAVLRQATAHPPISPHDWRGPASRSYDGLEVELRARISAADDAVEAALHSTRIGLGQLEHAMSGGAGAVGGG